MRDEGLQLYQRKREDWELPIVSDNREELKLDVTETLKLDVQEIPDDHGNKPGQYLELNEGKAKESRPSVLRQHPAQDNFKEGTDAILNQHTDQGYLPVSEGTITSLNQFTEKDKLTDLGSNNKPKATTYTIVRRTKSATTTKLPAVGLLCMLVFFNNAKSSLASTEDEIKIDNQIIMEGENFCFQYRQVVRSGICYVKFGDEVVSSEEQQDGRNLSLASGETWCTMCIRHFKLESIYVHLSAESNFNRTINKDLGEILKEKLSVYVPKDSEGNIIITTVGRNTKCCIQLPSMRYIINNTSEEHGNDKIRLVTRIIKYTTASTCSYTIVCIVTGGMTHSVTHEIENCSTVPTDSTVTTPTVTTQLTGNSTNTLITAINRYTTTTPSDPESKSDSPAINLHVAIGIGIVIVIIVIILIYIKRDKLKTLCKCRKHHDSDDLQNVQQGQEGIKMNVSEPETGNQTFSKTLTLVNQSLLHDRPSFLYESDA